MARGRSRHRTRPARRGRWYAAGAAALATAATVLITYGACTPSPASGTARTADRPASAATASSAPRTASPTPSPGHRTTPTPTPSASAATAAASRPAGPGPTTARETATAPHRQTPAAVPGGRRLITVVNRTAQPVWAVVTGTSAYPAGRRLAPGQAFSLTVAGDWGGRVWGRTGCTGSAAGPCASGDCTSVCTGPNPPTTLGEFTFDAYAGLDFYDVSMVDGANLPMYINISHTTTADPVGDTGCYRGTCTTEIDCPQAMRAYSGGRETGCKPPCAAFGGDTYCCRGAWAGRDHCVPAKWPVDYTRVFKRAAPYAYSYAYDDAATMSCKGACYYRVTFGTT
ncbi:thaumatin family protein [Streptomyces sp. NPDC101237]|uniref:thaumatin family protein n=1 Tax=Streptomyces sp. NPDC101237 TaxID=3366139 RepID=UPI003814D932